MKRRRHMVKSRCSSCGDKLPPSLREAALAVYCRNCRHEPTDLPKAMTASGACMIPVLTRLSGRDAARLDKHLGGVSRALGRGVTRTELVRDMILDELDRAERLGAPRA